MFSYLNGSFWSFVFVLLIIGTLLVVITDERDSGKKISWILVITFLPVIGIILYIMLGFDIRRVRLFRTRRRDFLRFFHSRSDAGTRRILFGNDATMKVDARYRDLATLLSKSNGTSVTDGNGIEIITSGKRKFEALSEDIRNARHHIHVEYFLFKKDKSSKMIKKLLMQKAKEGVKVRFIYENIANINIRPRYFKEMRKAGVEVVSFTDPKFSALRLSALLNYRDHRKIVVIDGKIGYTGGMNISDDYFIRWRDTHIRITGNAVASLQYSFMASFINSGGKIEDNLGPYFPVQEKQLGNDLLMQIVPDEPGDNWPILQMGTVWTVEHARDYIYIQTPYFVPPEPLLLALKSAALKGTDVRLMVPQKPDSVYMGPANRSYYHECLEAGIKIYEWTGTFIHSKTIVSDDYLSVIGSANMDFRSLEINYEVNSYIYSKDVALANRAIFMRDMKLCREITLNRWRKRPWYSKLGQSVMQLFAPIL